MDVFTEERQAEIIKIIDLKGRISVEELARKFNISEATIRRDLKTISTAYPNIKRTYGGAIKKTHPLHGAFWHGGFESIDNNENISLLSVTEKDNEPDSEKITFPENLSKNEVTNSPFYKIDDIGEGALSVLSQKDRIIRESNIRIAEFAVSFIGENDKIALEAADVNVLLAKKIPQNLNIKLFTNSPTISSIMSNPLCAADVYCSGGFLNKDYNAFLDLKAIEFFNEFFTDKAFISIDAIDSNYMISTYLKEKAEVKKNLIKSAKEKIVLCNSANLNTTLIFNAGNLRYADILIIDKGVDENFLKDLKSVNLRVYVV
jgi:DeoR/GlpR family transcriptional regulator of sugar metabolism